MLKMSLLSQECHFIDMSLKTKLSHPFISLPLYYLVFTTRTSMISGPLFFFTSAPLGLR